MPVLGVILDTGDTTASEIFMSETFLLVTLQRDLYVLIFNKKEKCDWGCLELSLHAL